MAEAREGRAIFISYRRDDTEGEAGRLYDDLVRAYSDDSVFMDVSDIEPGFDFRKAIDANVANCGVLLAVIGNTWASVTGSGGKRRLDNPNDFVRLEISSALARGIAVIPVLVHGAKMPALDQLPDDLKDLRYRNSVELTHARWNSDVALLVTALKNYVTVSKSRESETVHATVPVQLPAPNAAQPNTAPTKSKIPIFLGIGAALILVAGGSIFVAMRGRTGQPIATQPLPQSAPPTPISASPVPGNSANASSTSPMSPSLQPSQSSSNAPPTQKPSPPSGSQSGSQPAKQPAKQSLQQATKLPESQPDMDDTSQAVPLPSTVANLDAFLGNWKNSEEVKVAGELAALSIANFGGHIMVHAWGKCEDHLCDWGTTKATSKGQYVGTKFYVLGATERDSTVQRKASVSMTVGGGSMRVTVHNVYTQSDGQFREVFTPLQFEKRP